jgi:hypothetical protein
MPLLLKISEEFRKVNKKQLPFFFKDSLVLLNYCTFKNHLKENRDLKPKEEPHYLNHDYFQEKEFEDVEYFTECLFETPDNQKVRPKNFTRVDINKMKPETMYFVMKEEEYRSIHPQLLPKHPNVLKPWFTFFNEKKELMFTPFMLGGCLKNYLSKHLPLQKEHLAFYLAQLVIILESVEAEGKIYAKLSLENVFVKDNGYLMLDGVEEMVDLKSNESDKLSSKVSGNPYYFSPEVITNTGYHHEIVAWKLGVIAYYLVTGRFPFRGKNIKELYFNILFSPLEEADIPPFIPQLLEKDKSKRMTLKELMLHPCLEGTNWPMLES